MENFGFIAMSTISFATYAEHTFLLFILLLVGIAGKNSIDCPPRTALEKVVVNCYVERQF